MSSVKLGAGILLLASLKLAVRESFLPEYTSQVGPPRYRIQWMNSSISAVSAILICDRRAYQMDCISGNNGEDISARHC